MRLLSYNIHKGIGGQDRRYDLDRVIRVIEHENPDIVCLQEVTRHARWTHGDDQPSQFIEFFHPADHCFQMNVHYKVGGYGNLSWSRWPMVSRHQVSLRHNTRKPRGAQIMVIDSPEGSVQITNLHLGLRVRERAWQMNHLLHHPLFRESNHLPAIVLGDTNDWGNRLEESCMKFHEYQQATLPASKYRTFPAFLSMMSIDKAFFRGNINIREVRIVRTPLAHRASDHLPLVVDFHLTS